MYVTWRPKARDQLENLDNSIRERIKKKVNELINNPSHYSERLVGIDLFKLRIGDYRVLYRIDNDELLIEAVGHRSTVYK